jgi:hypothetical protein
MQSQVEEKNQGTCVSCEEAPCAKMRIRQPLRGPLQVT